MTEVKAHNGATQPKVKAVQSKGLQGWTMNKTAW